MNYKNKSVNPPCFVIRLPKSRDRSIFLNSVYKKLKHKYNMGFLLDHDIRIHENIMEQYKRAVELIKSIDVLLFYVQLDFLGCDEHLPEFHLVTSFLYIPFSIPIFVLPPDLNEIETEWVNDLLETFRIQCSNVYILPQDDDIVAYTIAREYGA